MDILCPVCKFRGSISDDLIPESGKRVSCPRCRASIFVRKPVISLTAGKSKGSSTGKPAGNSSPVPADTDTGVIRARCENCGGELKVPESKKMMLCPGCGANIVRQVVEEELEPGFIEYSIQAISQSFRSVFKGWGPYLKKRSIRRAAGVALALCVLLVLSFAIQWSKEFPGGLFHRKTDATLNVPPSGADLSSGKEGEGFLRSLMGTDIDASEEQQKEEVRIYQIVFKDGSKSDYFRYYRRDGGIVFIMLPDGRGGAYEQEYKDFDIQSIKRIEKPPGDVKIYGIN
jgi:hypothetical protein